MSPSTGQRTPFAAAHHYADNRIAISLPKVAREFFNCYSRDAANARPHTQTSKIKTHMKKIGLLFTVVAATALLIVGCATQLDPAGVYQGDTFLYDIDSQINLDETALNAFVVWEYQNHDAIAATWPDVVTAANTIRANAPTWFKTVGAVRADYISVRTTLGGLTNSPSLLAAQSNLVAAISVISAGVSNAAVAVNETTLTNKPTLTQ